MKSLSRTCVLFLMCWISELRAFVPAQGHARLFHTGSTRLWATSDDGGFNMEELKRRIAHDFNPMVLPTPTAAATDILHIVAFAENNGVHSVEYPKGSGCNIILAFASFTACEEFAARLRAQHFFDPQPQAIMTDTLHTFCEKMGVHLQIVPEGIDLIPPSQNVALVGRHNRSLQEQQKQLEYIFAMLDELEEGVEISATAFQ